MVLGSDPVKELRDIVYRTDEILSPRMSSRKRSYSATPVGAFTGTQIPKQIIPTSPELQPISRFNSIIERMKTGEGFSNKFAPFSEEIETARRANDSLMRILEAQRAQSLSSSTRRTSTGQLTSSYGSPAPQNVSGNVALGKRIAAQHGIVGREWDALYNLGMKESGWNNYAQNPNSSAFGIGQFLDQTWRSVGMRKTTDPATQILAMIRYIKQRYGSPSVALSGWHNRYGSGRSGY